MKDIPRLHKIKDGNRIYYSPDKNELNIYVNIKNELEYKYGIVPANRDMIIKQLISTLTHGDYINYNMESIDMFIIRTDISNFYPSINKHYLYKKIRNPNLISDHTLNVLKPIFFSPTVSGIPLGLPFSSVLAEIYLEKFDSDINLKFNPTFYFRYVDDIVILNYHPIEQINLNTAKEKLNTIFYDNYLKMNLSKTSFHHYLPSSKNNYDELSFDYLGYNFKTLNKKLIISISKNKLLKLLNKIKNYFYIFKRSNQSEKQFWILYYRLMNTLYGVKSKDENNKNMYFGLGYSYKFINDTEQLFFLISEVKGLIHSCRLNSKRTSALLYLISTNESVLDITSKRFDYTRLTTNQIKKIKSRLQIPSSSNDISKIFYYLYK